MLQNLPVQSTCSLALEWNTVGRISSGLHPNHSHLPLKLERTVVPAQNCVVANLVPFRDLELETQQLHSVILGICNPSSLHMLSIDFHYDEGCPSISAFSPNLDSKLLFWYLYFMVESSWYGPRICSLRWVSIYRLTTLGLMIVGVYSGGDLLLP